MYRWSQLTLTRRVFGAIAPRAFARSYRFDDTNASLVHLTRLLDTRNATLGALGMLTNSSADRRTFLTADSP